LQPQATPRHAPRTGSVFVFFILAHPVSAANSTQDQQCLAVNVMYVSRRWSRDASLSTLNEWRSLALDDDDVTVSFTRDHYSPQWAPWRLPNALRNVIADKSYGVLSRSRFEYTQYILQYINPLDRRKEVTTTDKGLSIMQSHRYNAVLL